MEERNMKQEARAQSLTLAVLSLIVNLYGFTVFIAVPYYNWQYARDHTLRDWLIWGEVIPTAKAFAWPYFVMQNVESHEVERHPGRLHKNKSLM